MLKSMEARGLVVRERASGQLIDAREKLVMLTRLGFETIVNAIKAFLRDDDLRAFYDKMHDQGVKHIKTLVEGVRNIAGWLRDFATYRYTEERPDVAGGERYDAQVKEEVDRNERRWAAQAEGRRGLAAIAPEDKPDSLDYFIHPKNVALAKTDPAAWKAKIERDFHNHAHFYQLAYLTGGDVYD